MNQLQDVAFMGAVALLLLAVISAVFLFGELKYTTYRFTQKCQEVENLCREREELYNCLLELAYPSRLMTATDMKHLAKTTLERVYRANPS